MSRTRPLDRQFQSTNAAITQQLFLLTVTAANPVRIATLPKAAKPEPKVEMPIPKKAFRQHSFYGNNHRIQQIGGANNCHRQPGGPRKPRK